jgi:hypothetical protein
MTNSLVLPARARFGALLAAALLVLSALVLVPGTSAQAAAGGTTLSAGQTLRSGQSISNGGYRLVMQSDGNAVVYASGGRVRWHTRTNGNAGARLVMQGDGNLVVYSKAGRALWHTRTNGNSGARLAIQTDGNLVVYSRYSKPLWHIGPDSGVKTVSATGLYAIRSGLPVGACGDPVGLARSMATKRSLFHGGSGWHGQIVAVGSDSSSLVNAWRNSPPHMTVARDGSWTRMSAGAARGTDGRMYGVVNFCR